MRIGYLGRLHPTKGVELLLDAFAKVSEEGSELFLAGTGDPAYEAELKRRQQRRNIHFLGFTQPEEFFSKIDVLAVPSIWNEPAGLVIMEAYSHGVPVVGSNRGGIPELIDSGRTGFVFDPDHPAALEAAIRRFFADPGLSARMGHEAMVQSKSFASQRMVEDYLRVYEETSVEKIDRQARRDSSSVSQAR